MIRVPVRNRTQTHIHIHISTSHTTPLSRNRCLFTACVLSAVEIWRVFLPAPMHKQRMQFLAFGVALGLSATVASPANWRELPASVCCDGGTKVRYFAFGSNLLRSKMEGRGDTEVLECVPAIVSDHRLAFNMRMFPPLEPSMASLEPSAGSVCEGAVYTLTRAGYEALWKSEGGSMDRPGYQEVVVRASVGSETVDAITLRAAPWMRMKRDAPPSARYKKLIIDGASELGLSSGYVAWLSGLRATSPSKALTAIVRAHGVVAVLIFRLSTALKTPALRNVLFPIRAACYILLRRGPSTTVVDRMLDLASEMATGALLLPTAALGFLIRLVLQLLGKEKLVQMGPPSAAKPKEKVSALVRADS